MSERLLNEIASYGKIYRQKFLNSYNPKELKSNFWLALDFFLSRAFYQGRRDAMSERVYRAAIEVLKPELLTTSGASKYQTLKEQKWETIGKLLRSKIGKGYVGRGRDVDMVLKTLDFISLLPDLNLVRYSIEQIESGNLEKHYFELQARKSKKLQARESKRGIIQVGPKIASFYLRDVISLYGLDDKIPSSSAYCLQPVDTWVKKVAYRLKIVDEGERNSKKIQQAIASLCKAKDVSPILFNQGAWYVGNRAFDVVLELLDTRNGSVAPPPNDSLKPTAN